MSIRLWCLGGLLIGNPLRAQETNGPIKVVVVLIIDQNYLTNLLNLITNFNNELVNPKYKELELMIQAEEKRIVKLYDGYPTNFVAPSTPENDKVLDGLIKLWAEKDAAISNLNRMKSQLYRMKVQSELAAALSTTFPLASNPL